MQFLLAVVMVLPGLAWAEGWRPLSGAEIAALLTGAEVTYSDAHQTFDARGYTTYTYDRPTEGRWWVTGDQYCSVWPPSDRWVCYDVTASGDAVRFIGPDQSVSQGVVAR